MKRWIVTLGGSGYLPAGGTWGSLLTCLILWPLLVWFPSEVSQNVISIAGMVIFSALCVALGRWAVIFFRREDPGPCVLDEAAGICLTLLLQPVSVPVAYRLLAVFLAFRLFDITKIPPARQLERLPFGWGILLDDLAAAIYANVACQIVLRWIFAK